MLKIPNYNVVVPITPDLHLYTVPRYVYDAERHALSHTVQVNEVVTVKLPWLPTAQDWVEVYVDRTNSKQAKELIASGFKKSYKPKCLSLWSPGAYHGQSMDVKEAGAHAFAEVLQRAGLKAYACSRAD